MKKMNKLEEKNEDLLKNINELKEEIKNEKIKDIEVKMNIIGKGEDGENNSIMHKQLLIMRKM